MAEHTVTFESVAPISKKISYAFDRNVTLTDLEQILAEVRAVTMSITPVALSLTVTNWLPIRLAKPRGSCEASAT